MSSTFSYIDTALLDYLEAKYQVKKGSALFDNVSLLLQRFKQGSICVPVELTEKTKAVGIVSKEIDNIPAVPLIYDGKYLYIQRYYVYQTRIIKKLEKLTDNCNLSIITGGPGTGKTTSLYDILKEKLDKNILLAAPTGKAAVRMEESLEGKGINRAAKTIHRLLGSLHLSVNFKRTSENPLVADIIAIDECSMVDLPLMAKLLDAIPDTGCHLYLLGDKNQLASVEAGSVFADICKKYENNSGVYTELRKNYRSQEAKGIIELSEKILTNTAESFSNNNVKHCEKLSISNLYEKYRDLLYADNETKALEKLKTFQVLCAIKNGNSGTNNINKRLLEKANKNNAKFTPIIITENNYQQNLFNGDVGVKDRQNAYFPGETGVISFPLLILPAHEDAFAITIHKSQGSEYEHAAVVYPDKFNEGDEQTIFTRELLYTAITRAKKECSIYGSIEVLKKSCEREIFRASGIK